MDDHFHRCLSFPSLNGSFVLHRSVYHIITVAFYSLWDNLDSSGSPTTFGYNGGH